MFALSLSVFVATAGQSCVMLADAPKSSLTQAIRVLSRDRSVSFNAWLRESARLVKRQYLKRKWADVERELREEHIVSREAWKKQYVQFDYYSALKGLRRGNGYPFDLEYKFVVARPDDPKPYAGEIIGVHAVARLTPGQPLRDVLGKGMLPRDSAFAKALRSDQVQRSAEKYPYVATLEASYELHGNLWAKFRPYCFEVRVELAKAVGARAEKKVEFVSIESHLDAPEAADGSKQAEFHTSDTLGGSL